MEKILTYTFTNKSNHKIWFTSDTHFYHTNIIKYCNRPFANAEEMNEELIKNWNSVVKKNDIVFHLGDFGFAEADKVLDIANRLNGKIYLIIGNHDWKMMQEPKLLERFAGVYQQMRIVIDGQKIYLNHFPLLCFDGSYRNEKPVWQLFGHVHSGPLSDGLDSPRLSALFPTQYDVGVDNNNFTPISFDEVTAKINKQRANYSKNENSSLEFLLRPFRSLLRHFR